METANEMTVEEATAALVRAREKQKLTARTDLVENCSQALTAAGVQFATTAAGVTFYTVGGEWQPWNRRYGQITALLAVDHQRSFPPATLAAAVSSLVYRSRQSPEFQPPQPAASSREKPPEMLAALLALAGTGFSGLVSELLAAIRSQQPAELQSGWPTTAAELGKLLSLFAADLAAAGVSFARKSTKRGSFVSLRMTAETAAAA